MKFCHLCLIAIACLFAFSCEKVSIDSDTYTKYFSLDAGITKFRVYIWVEGQDVDCENDASGSKVSYNIQLSMDNGA
jgi:hypothetical protein